jgi:LacI family transcriptional regulator
VEPRAGRRPAGNDLRAIGIIDALAHAEVRVPDDVTVVGYDDIPFAATAVVPLTTVRQPIAEIGTTAARAFSSRRSQTTAASRATSCFPPTSGCERVRR